MPGSSQVPERIRQLLSIFLAVLALSTATLPDGARAATPRTNPGLAVDDAAPISATNPRAWPAAALPGSLSLGAVDAWMAPERAVEAKVQWSRVVFSWADLQPGGPDDWSGPWLEANGTDARLDVELRAGRRVVGVLARTPPWAATRDGYTADPPRNLDLPYDDPNNYWGRYVAKVVERYAGRVDDWIIWNEPDVWSFETNSQQWTGTTEEYYRLLKVGYLAAKKTRPYARVWLAGLTYYWDYLYGRDQYLSRLLDVAAADPTAPANNWYFDGAVLQLYNNPRALFDVPRVFQRIMADHGVDPVKPIWVNEINVVPWDDPIAPLTAEHYRGTMDEQASYLVQALAHAMAAGVDHVAVFKWVDDNGLKKNVEQAFGMLRFDPLAPPRPVYYAYRAAQDWLAPTTRAQLVDEGAVVTVYLEQPSLGRRVTVLWNMEGAALTTEFKTLGSVVRVVDKFGREIDRLLPGPSGTVTVPLGPATANTLPGYPGSYFIGGDPLLLVEELPADYQPFPSAPNLPAPPLRQE